MFASTRSITAGLAVLLASVCVAGATPLQLTATAADCTSCGDINFFGQGVGASDGCDLREAIAPSSSCCELCERQDGCTGYTWDSNVEHCFLKNVSNCKRQEALPNQTLISAVLAGRGGTCHAPNAQCTFLMDMDSGDPGTEVDGIKDLGACCKLCADNTECKASVYLIDYHNCYLKTDFNLPTARTGSVVSVPTRGTCKYEKGLDYKDFGAIYPGTASEEQCCSICHADSLCKGSVYSALETKCYTKYSLTVPEKKKGSTACIAAK